MKFNIELPRASGRLIGVEYCTSGYPFDPSIRWNIVVSRFHLTDGF